MDNQTTQPVQLVQSDNKPLEESTGPNKILLGILVIIVILILYFAFSKFTSNKNSFSSGLQSEKDDPSGDFNLEECIGNLEKKQNKIVNKLSDNVDI